MISYLDFEVRSIRWIQRFRQLNVLFVRRFYFSLGISWDIHIWTRNIFIANWILSREWKKYIPLKCGRRNLKKKKTLFSPKSISGTVDANKEVISKTLGWEIDNNFSQFVSISVCWCRECLLAQSLLIRPFFFSAGGEIWKEYSENECLSI